MSPVQFGLSLCLASCLLSAAPVRAETPVLRLQAAQIKALGVSSQLLKAGPGQQAGLAARVVVPNEQLRVVAAPVAGLVESLLVAPGMAVKKGQVLARLASPQALVLQREQVQAASQAQLARQTLSRDETLFSEGLIAESRLQASRAAAQQADAQWAERRQSLALAGLGPGAKTGSGLALVAPLDGVILEQNVAVGQQVEMAAPLYRLARLSPLLLEIQAPVALTTDLVLGSPVQVVGSSAQGRLSAIGRAVDPATQTVLLRATVQEGAATLRPGQSVEVALALPTAKGQRLPASALIRQGNDTLVFVEEADGKDAPDSRVYKPHPVRLLAQQGDSVVVDGLSGQERLVVRGTSALKAMLTGVGKE